MTVEPRVSVVVPLYGTHRGRSVLPAVVRAWLAQDVPCEVIVATAQPLDAELASDRARVVVAGELAASPGVLRNIAAAAAAAPQLYLADADVAPLGRGFLRAVMALAADGVAIQPWMHRLTAASGPFDAAEAEHSPAGRCCFVHAGPDGVLRPLGHESFRIRQPGGPLEDHDVLAVLPPPTERAPDLPPRRQWVAAFHWGGALLSRGLFRDVGGYCARYQGWGSEDDDLLVKLAGRVRLVRAWRADPSAACVHYEHPRHDIAAAQATANRAVLAERIAAGSEAMVAEDRAAQARAPG